MVPSDLQILVLAALLHDIGEFCHRAEGVGSRAMEGGNRLQEKNPQNHRQVLHTDFFIRHDLPLPTELDNEHMRERLARLASSYHKPSEKELLELALCAGDRLSAGADRRSGEKANGEEENARLLSIFEQLSLKGARPLAELQEGLRHRLASIEDDPFPVPLELARQSGYSELFTDFKAGLQNLPLKMGVARYIASLVSLLEKYTWCIPSSAHNSLTDISLFDHSHITAAIAQALAVYHDEEKGLPGQDEATSAKFLLLGGDLSGIQQYIFKLDKSQGSGVAKLFRARSFFLQALTRSVVLELLDRLALHPVARIADAGGRFILLLPNTRRVRTLLPDFELEVQRFFFVRFRGALSLNLCGETTLTENDLDMKHFKARLDDFYDALESRKLRKFDRLLATGINPVINTDYAAYEYGDCSVCHAQPVDREATAEHLHRYGQEVRLCRDCADQIRLIGQKLPRCTFLVFDKTVKRGSVELFAGQGLRLLESLDHEQERQALEIVNIRTRGEFAYQPIAAHLPCIDSEDLARWEAWGVLTRGADGLLSHREELVTAGDPKTFQLLALDARESGLDGQPTGRSFLGAFKADVDNLGLLFGIGLQDRLSVSRFASLSRMLNHFFSDDLVAFLRAEFPNLYMVFAGGDDLFLLGPWNQVVQFAVRVQERFKHFVCQRPEVTLSAGVAVVKPTLPMHAIAEQVEGLLEASKHHPGKNAVTLFDTTVGWDGFTGLIDTGDWLHRLAGAGTISRGLLGRLMTYGRESRAFRNGDIERGIYMSHMAYDFARNLKEKQLPDPVERARILGIQQDAFLLDNIQIPVSYALYRLRKEG